jgi:hypothetical protein
MSGNKKPSPQSRDGSSKVAIDISWMRMLFYLTLNLQHLLREVQNWPRERARWPKNKINVIKAYIDEVVGGVDRAWIAIQNNVKLMNPPKATSTPWGGCWASTASATINTMLLALHLPNPSQYDKESHFLTVIQAVKDGLPTADRLLELAYRLEDAAMELHYVDGVRKSRMLKSGVQNTMDIIEEFIRSQQPVSLEQIAEVALLATDTVKTHYLPHLINRGLIRPGRGSRGGYRWDSSSKMTAPHLFSR